MNALIPFSTADAEAALTAFRQFCTSANYPLKNI